jgi:predicted DNA-binding transcriptional regulator AlpA
MSTRLNLTEAERLPASLSLIEAAALLGIGRTHAYNLAAAGRFPVRVLRLGRVIRVPTAPLLYLLGLAASADAPEPPATRPAPGGAVEEPAAHPEEPS